MNIYTHDNFYGEDNGNDPDLVRIDPDRKGYVIIRTLEWDDEISWHKEIEKSIKIE